MGRAKAFLAAVVAAVVVSGCVMGGKAGRDFSTDDVKKIRTGVTTKSQVVAMFGEPPARNIMPDGKEIWAYSFVDLGVGVLGSHTSQRGLSIAFNTKNVVTNCTMTSWNTSASIGQAGQTRMLSAPCNRL